MLSSVLKRWHVFPPQDFLCDRNHFLPPDDDDDDDDDLNDETYIPSDQSISSSFSNSNVTNITGVSDKESDSDNNNNNNNKEYPRNEENNNNNHKDNTKNNPDDNKNNADKKEINADKNEITAEDNENNNDASEHNDTNSIEDNNNKNNATWTRSGRQVRRNKRDADVYEYNHFNVDADCDIVPLSTENEYNNYVNTVEFLDGKNSPDHPDMINVWILLQ